MSFIIIIIINQSRKRQSVRPVLVKGEKQFQHSAGRVGWEQNITVALKGLHRGVCQEKV
jgi:hypothetical protein